MNGHGRIVPLDIIFYRLFALYESRDSLRLRNRIIWHFEHGAALPAAILRKVRNDSWYTKGDKYRFDLDAVRIPAEVPGETSVSRTEEGSVPGKSSWKESRRRVDFS